MPHLFEPLTIKGRTLRNRIGMSPMCQYSATDGLADDWHLLHYGARAVGGAGLVIVEATGVEPRGRITPGDLGLWNDGQAEALARVASVIEGNGALPGIQLAHAGRKASHMKPWEGEPPLPQEKGGWPVIGPSAIPFGDGEPTPAALTKSDIATVADAFKKAAIRARDAGFGFAELHSAHGYLCHSFYSPLSNKREDEYGGSFENRIRFPLEVFRAIRSVWPEDRILGARISCTDWVNGGWTVEDSVSLAKRLKDEGGDIIDCSSAGIVPYAKVRAGAGFQVPFSEAVRKGAGILTTTVGMITDPMQADEIIRNDRADIVLLGRELLRNPYWPLTAARAINQADNIFVPPQYWRAVPGGSNRKK